MLWRLILWTLSNIIMINIRLNKIVFITINQLTGIEGLPVGMYWYIWAEPRCTPWQNSIGQWGFPAPVRVLTFLFIYGTYVTWYSTIYGIRCKQIFLTFRSYLRILLWHGEKAFSATGLERERLDCIKRNYIYRAHVRWSLYSSNDAGYWTIPRQDVSPTWTYILGLVHMMARS